MTSHLSPASLPSVASLNEVLNEGLDPQDFMLAWGLKVSQTAPLLGIQEWTLRSYYFRESPKKSFPPDTVRIAAATRTYIWLKEGYRPENPSRCALFLKLVGFPLEVDKS